MVYDPYSGRATEMSDPAVGHFLITPSDSADLEKRPRCIYCGSDGDVALRDAAGVDITYAVVVGTRIDLRATRVLETGTTVGMQLVGWY